MCWRVNAVSVLAFPRNPYHHLVKHYPHGQLQRGRWNDPELDARLTLEVFRVTAPSARECAGWREKSTSAG